MYKRQLQDHPQADALYTDEDKVTTELDEHFQPHLKPDFNLDLLRSNNYICHFFVVRKSIVEKAGGFRKEFDGAQDYDFIFRCTENAGEVLHVSEILYHWRTHKASTADNPASKMYAFEAGKRAIEAHLERTGTKGEVSHTQDLGFYRVKYPVQGQPLVSIIIPNKDEKETLKACIDSIREKTEYPNYEIIIVDNGSEDETPQIAEMLCQKYEKVRYERINVRGVGAAFRRGVELSHGDVVGYMDIDLSTNIKHLGEAIHLFETQPQIEYINGSRFARESDTKGRKWYRRITSQGLLILLKLFLRMKSTDAICGFTFVRRQTALSLIEGCSQDNGWFYTIEFLLRAERDGMKIYDMPVEWQEDYNTTVKVWKTIKNYLIQMYHLKKAFRQEDKLRK